MLVRSSQQPDGQQVDRQTDVGHHHRLQRLQWLHVKQTPPRFQHDAQQQGTGVGGQGVDLAAAQAETVVAGVASRQVIGAGGKPQSDGVAAHADAIREQHHGAGPPPRYHLDHHRHAGDGRHHQGARFGAVMRTLAEVVVVMDARLGGAGRNGLNGRRDHRPTPA